jgi:hypothetical protein
MPEFNDSEYATELTDMADEWQLGKDTTAIIKGREESIRARVLEVADKVSPGARAIFPLPGGLAWDRQRAKKAGTGDVSLDTLERVLGPERFRELCCEERTTFVFSMGLFDMARANGDITDADLAQAQIPTEYQPRLSLIKYSPKAPGEYNEQE